MKVFELTGAKIAEFDLSSMSNSARKKYGKFILLLVVDEGIFPVPPKYQGDIPSKRREIIAFYHKERKGI